MRTAGGVAAPPQDQCMIPRVADQRIWDEVSGANYGMSGYSVAEDPEPALVCNGANTSPALAVTGSGLPMKTHTGSFTLLVRAFGRGSASNTKALIGDIGIPPDRGFGAGPNNSGDGNFNVAVSDTEIVSSGNVSGMHPNDAVYRDYAYIFESGVRLTQYKNSTIQSENTTGIPAVRHINTTLHVRAANRGDRTAVAPNDSYLTGRIRFWFWYNRVLTADEMAAAFANGGYVPQ